MTRPEEIFARELPDSALTMQFELRVSGSIDVSRLTGAVGAALEAHPMSRARLASPRFLLRSPRWEVVEANTDGVVTAVDCADESSMTRIRDDFYGRNPDLRASPAVRVLLARRRGGDSLLFGIHHALMDGIGAIRWVNSVARAYAGLPDPLPDIDPIAARDVFAVAGDRAATSVSGGRARRPTGPVSAVAGIGPPDALGSGIVHASLSPDECARLDPSRYGPETTVNDLLLASLHLTIDRWNASKGRETRWISVIVPANVRPAAWGNEVAVMLVIADRNYSSPEDRASPDSLVTAVTAQMVRMRSGPGFARILTRSTFVRRLILDVVLPLIVYRPELVPRVVKGPIDTMVFANMGRIEKKISGFGPEAGHLTEFWASPPVSRYMRLGMDAVFLRGSLHLALRYSRTLFDEEGAGAFLASFRRTLNEIGTTPD